MHDYDLLVVGSANADLVIGVERRPAPGRPCSAPTWPSTPAARAPTRPSPPPASAPVRRCSPGSATTRTGGCCSTRSGRPVSTPVGVLVGGAPTGVALITVDPSGDNSIVVSPGANARLTPGGRPRRRRPARRPPGSSRRSWRSRWRRSSRSYGIWPAGTRFVLNPSPPAPLPADVLAACDPLIVNEHEARFMLGDAARAGAPEDWARALLALGPRSVVVTLGAQGALVADGRTGTGSGCRPSGSTPWTRPGRATPSPRRWPGGSALGEDLATAAAFAARVGAAAVTREGAQASFPTAEEVSAL